MIFECEEIHLDLISVACCSMLSTTIEVSCWKAISIKILWMGARRSSLIVSLDILVQLLVVESRGVGGGEGEEKGKGGSLL